MGAVLVVALVLPWLLLAAVSWMLYQLIRQQGRILLAQEAMSTQLATVQSMLTGQYPQQQPQEVPTGLAVGEPAPDFALPDLDGRERRLEEFLGEPVLVGFFS